MVALCGPYVERGGTLFGDAICASEPFAEAVKREFSAVFPQSKWRRIPPKHPLFSEAFGGFDLTTVSLRDPQLATPDDPLTAKIVRTAPLLEALEVDGRPAVIFSPYDLSCALESRGSLECKGYLKEDALKLGVNVILFVLQH